MRALSAGELLNVWEDSFALAHTERALALLRAACPETSPDALAALSIGQRDAKLLMLRERLWGPEMAALAACPSCRERLELPLNIQQMLSSSPSTRSEDLISLSVGEYQMTLRLPTSQDVIAAAGQANLAGSQSLILEQCLSSVLKGGAPVDSDKMPPEIIESVVNCLAKSDPLADIKLNLTCPSCNYRWRAVFDIVSFLWTEIEIWAWRMLRDVHTLARAYGWCERDILMLSPARRQFYLEMAGA